MDLQILITVYNEGHKLEQVVSGIIRELADMDFQYHITILNDGSTDWSQAREDRLKAMENVGVKNFTSNRGKGAVLNAIFPELEGGITVVIDADNEYAPSDIRPVIAPLIRNEADWVLGSRYGFKRKRPKQYAMTYLANMFLNGLFNILSGLNLHDLLSGLFAFKSEMIKGVSLRQKRFAFTPELMWKVQRKKQPRWTEVPISYRFRTYKEGKKNEWWEVFTVTWAIIFYRFKRL